MRYVSEIDYIASTGLLVQSVRPNLSSRYKFKDATEVIIKSLKDEGAISAAQAKSTMLIDAIAPKIGRAYSAAKGNMMKRVDGKFSCASLDKFVDSVFNGRGKRIQDAHRRRAALIRHYRPLMDKGRGGEDPKAHIKDVKPGGYAQQSSWRRRWRGRPHSLEVLDKLSAKAG
ncbi:hypothetical protein DFS34DRAFT_652337 [Phlyctochytrium arcticum]|nr:hypothetical protein DFS34DRAFT_652337 [Phlyctochytrium arcticum]